MLFRSPDRAALVQRVRHDGTVEWSGYLPAGVTPPTCKKPVLVPALEVGTVLAAASAATLFAVAAVERNEALEVASRIDAGETVLPGDLGDCASHLESGDSAGRAAWSRCVGRAYDETYVTPVNTLGYAAEGAAGVAVVLGGAALVFSVQW